VTRPVDIPSEARARRVLEQYVSECQANGRHPSVLGLASQLGLRNTTFRRHFPDLAKEIATVRSTPTTEAGAGAEGPPTPYDVLVARNAKLRRANRILTDNLRLAIAHIQRLGVDNARLRGALEAASNITHIDRPDRPRRH
jgi:hypothetical protein